MLCFFFSSRRRHTRWTGDWSSDVCSSDLVVRRQVEAALREGGRAQPGAAVQRDEQRVLEGHGVDIVAEERCRDAKVEAARGIAELDASEEVVGIVVDG